MWALEPGCLCLKWGTATYWLCDLVQLSSLSFLGLSFLIFKIKIIVVTRSRGCCKENELIHTQHMLNECYSLILLLLCSSIFTYKIGDKNIYLTTLSCRSNEATDVEMSFHLNSTVYMLKLNLENIPHHLFRP